MTRPRRNTQRICAHCHNGKFCGSKPRWGLTTHAGTVFTCDEHLLCAIERVKGEAQLRQLEEE